MAFYKIIFINGPDAGKEFPLEKNEVFIGRDDTNDITINSAEVSRVHARLTLTGNTYLIEDIQSTNGTIIRNLRIAAPVMLRPGDIITFGKSIQVKFETVWGGIDQKSRNFHDSELQTKKLDDLDDLEDELPLPSASILEKKTEIEPLAPEDDQKRQKDVEISTSPTNEGVSPTQPIQPPVVSKKKVKTSNKDLSSKAIVLIVLCIFVLVFCLIPWIFFELSDSYCIFIPRLYNYFNPAYCH